MLPFFHIYGLTALMNAPLRLGATVVVLPRFDLEQFLAAIQNHRITSLYVAPPIVLALAKHPLVGDYDLSSLKYVVSAAAPLDARLAAACSRRLGLPPVGQAYGMTELSPGTHVVPLDAMAAAPPGTVGKLIAGTEMRIVSSPTPARTSDRRIRRDPHPRPAGRGRRRAATGRAAGDPDLAQPGVPGPAGDERGRAGRESSTVG
ncbi:4-coumarate--CoA ligase family protein OS=Streptomyces tendae OX=1932 GN=GUR47_26895 PE=4 SV=1 [Streptomyces tendae]